MLLEQAFWNLPQAFVEVGFATVNRKEPIKVSNFIFSCFNFFKRCIVCAALVVSMHACRCRCAAAAMHSVPCSRRRDACSFAAVDLPLQCIVCAALVVAVHELSLPSRCIVLPALASATHFVVPAVAPLYPCMVCPALAVAMHMSVGGVDSP